LKVFIDGTWLCFLFLVRPSLVQSLLERDRTLIVGNLETTLLENNFYINSF